jgi:hypothetical protein
VSLSFSDGVNNAVQIIKAFKLSVKGMDNFTPGHFENYVTSGEFDVTNTIERLWVVLGKAADFSQYKLMNGCILIPKSKSKATNLCPEGKVTISTYDWDVPVYLNSVLANKLGFVPFAAPKEITLAENAVRPKAPATTAEAIANWKKANLPVVTEEQYKLRHDLCEACEHFAGGGFMGAGSCKKCGCSGAKLFQPSSTCPIKKWEAV